MAWGSCLAVTGLGQHAACHITVDMALQGLTVGRITSLAVLLMALCATAVAACCSTSMHHDGGFLAILGCHACVMQYDQRRTCLWT